MFGLSLCSGIAGLELGIGLVCPSYRTVCYVEGELYAAAVLATRMEEGHLDTAPIYSSLESFDARKWRGCVDIVTAGFPCQPFSVAGKREAEEDERHVWPEIQRIISECEPAFVFLENVSIRAFVEPWRDLRRLGFDLSRPYACSAAELGAGFVGERVFVLGTSDDQGRLQQGWFFGAVGGRDCDSTWWASESGVQRLASRPTNGVERDRALGNAVVPVMAAKAFRDLMGELVRPQQAVRGSLLRPDATTFHLEE